MTEPTDAQCSDHAVVADTDWKLGDALVADTTHTAESLQPGDAVAKRRIQNGDVIDPTTQLRVVCSVEVVS